jgi:hypothetical protein
MSVSFCPEWIAVREPQTTPHRMPVVADNPGYAWDESDQAAVYSLDRGFVSAHRELLDQAAYDLIRPFLVSAWRKRGLTVQFEHDRNRFTSDTTPDDPDTTTYHAVWQEAADQVTTEALLDRAGFTAAETRTYA